MDTVRSEISGDKITIFLSGRIDSGNASQVEEAILAELDKANVKKVVLDAADLEYISSAGLRVILHIRKMNEDLTVTNTSPEVYDIFDMTGFTQMFTVEKAYRIVSIEGCEEIGRGANGTIYRIDKDNVVKVYNNADALENIQHEREVAKLALILGIPTAISYDVVKVGDSYGSVFELLNAKSFSKILSKEPEKIDWCVNEYVNMLKKIHGTVVPEGKLPDMKEVALEWANFTKDYLPEDLGEKLVRMIEEIPKDDHMIHGDYHTKNLELTGDEVLLIDMDTLAVGNPIFEFASMYNAFIGFSECNHEIIKSFQGFDITTSEEFWNKTLKLYLNTDDPERIKEFEDKARVLGYTRLIRRAIRRGGLDDPERKKEIDHWREELIELLKTVDTLDVSLNVDISTSKSDSPSNELDIEAVGENLQTVLDFVDKHLDDIDCPMKEKIQIDVAVEEIFINIANYAYHPGKGNATVRVEVSDDPVTVTITFIDKGIPYDPLAKKDPDITLSAEEREIGGLGIFMVKKTMDNVDYEYKDGQNILRIKKSIS